LRTVAADIRRADALADERSCNLDDALSVRSYGTGILESTDGGDTISVTAVGTGAPGNTDFFQQSISKILALPDGTLYAALVPPQSRLPSIPDPRFGIYRSTDGGSIWNKVTNGNVDGNGNPSGIGASIVVTDLEWTLQNNQVTLFAAVGNIWGDPLNGVYKGVLQGNNVVWNLAPIPGLPLGKNLGRISLASDHQSLLYAAIVGPLGRATDPPPALVGVYRSANNGATWSNTNVPDFTDGQGYFNLAIGVSPDKRAYLGGLDDAYTKPPKYGLFELDPTGSAWRAVDGGTNGTWPHTDVHAFAFASNGTVYVGTDGGLFRYNPMPLEPAQAYLSGVTSSALAVGNFDGKNGTDIAVLDVGAPNPRVSILLNNGDGTFSDGGSYAVDALGAVATSMVVGDFNGDGKADIAVTNSTTNTVSILMNTGVGTPNNLFAPFVPYPTGRGPKAVVAADFDQQKGLDLAVVNSIDRTVSILLNNGDSTFAAPVPYFAGAQPTALAVGDFDGKNGPDLAITDSLSRQVRVLLNNGTGVFPTANNPPRYNVGTDPEGITVGDFDGKNGLDLALANQGSNNVSILLNNGNGTFPATATN
jgi:hypothetical protein